MVNNFKTALYHDDCIVISKLVESLLSATLNIDSAPGIYLKKIESFYIFFMSLIKTKTVQFISVQKKKTCIIGHG